MWMHSVTQLSWTKRRQLANAQVAQKVHADQADLQPVTVGWPSLFSVWQVSPHLLNEDFYAQIGWIARSASSFTSLRSSAFPNWRRSLSAWFPLFELLLLASLFSTASVSFPNPYNSPTKTLGLGASNAISRMSACHNNCKLRICNSLSRLVIAKKWWH